MQIINLVTQLEPGGAQGAAIRMSRQMRRRGHDAETWFLYKKIDCYAQEPNIRVMLPRKLRSPFDVLLIAWRLWGAFRSFSPDGVVAYTHYANTVGLLVALLAGVQSRVASQRNPYESYPFPARLLDGTLGALGLYSSNIAVSECVASSFCGHSLAYRRRLKVIYNGLEPQRSEFSKREAREFFGLPLQPPLMLSVGRLVHQKNQEILLRALTLLPEVHLAIAGEGELRGSLEELARELFVSDRVHFLGPLDPARVKDFLAAGDLFVFPSRYEAFGFALLEAAYAQLPIIASSIPSSLELFGPTETDAVSLFVDGDQPREWAEAVQSIFACPTRAESLCRGALARASKFTLSRMVDEYENEVQSNLVSRANV